MNARSEHPTRIRVVLLGDPAECQRTEKVQRDAWGISPLESIIPFHTLIAAQHHSGLILGAYENNRMVGCLFGISAYDEKRKRPYHYSHITAVLRSYQKKGVGMRLKKAQRDHLLRQEIDLVKWTFDPLQAGNAYFNLHKLGAIARQYHRNLYGKMPDVLNRGMISDRFEAEWWLDSQRVRDRLKGRPKHSEPSKILDPSIQLINGTMLDQGVRVPVSAKVELDDSRLLFEIPYSIGKVKQKDLRLARKWTMHARKSFEHYFRRGYAATDVQLDERPRENRVYYLLEHGVTI